MNKKTSFYTRREKKDIFFSLFDLTNGRNEDFSNPNDITELLEKEYTFQEIEMLITKIYRRQKREKFFNSVFYAKRREKKFSKNPLTHNGGYTSSFFFIAILNSYLYSNESLKKKFSLKDLIDMFIWESAGIFQLNMFQDCRIFLTIGRYINLNLDGIIKLIKELSQIDSLADMKDQIPRMILNGFSLRTISGKNKYRNLGKFDFENTSISPEEFIKEYGQYLDINTIFDIAEKFKLNESDDAEYVVKAIKGTIISELSVTTGFNKSRFEIELPDDLSSLMLLYSELADKSKKDSDDTGICCSSGG